ncbi:type IX secretion system sortase PorU [Adhaeribacter aquaticus]|uniref:type IX secretion system sortase PorU n=1 Tax=Adhaeribacter aquaticus TaxID=299567 RepID=UPI0004042B3D|nr:type IX secretion system sortase PorU [Adhaeribacter aquaticus]
MSNRFTGHIILFFFFISFTGIAQPTPKNTASSVLSTGNWYKLGVTGPGMYKIDHAFLQKLGIQPDVINPKNIGIYGNGGAMLPQANKLSRPDDLHQNAIYIAGEADNKFDGTDYILFYAPGPHQWQYHEGTKQFTHDYNIYSDTAYYFLTIGHSPGKRVSQTSIPGSGPLIETFIDHVYHEQDHVNMLQSGREWYGEIFNSNTRTRDLTFPLPDVVPNSTILVTSAVMANSPNSSSFTLSANNTPLGTQSFTGRGSHYYHAEGENNIKTYPVNFNALTTSNSIKLSLTYNNNGISEATGYLNYLEVNAERALKLTGNFLAFRSLANRGANNISTFKINNVTENAQVWDVTNLHAARALPFQVNNDTGTFNTKSDSLREFVVFTGNNFPAPFTAGKVANQSLHGLNLNGDLDFVIITHPLFKAQADKLANHRRTRDQLQVEVVTTQAIYNEFSSGAQDVTAIRDFMRMLYNRRNTSSGKTLYLLLFGDASYDYKSGNNTSKVRTPNNSNFVPVYESRESLNPLSTYSSDDYYGLLEDQEGVWSEDNFSFSETVDIGIGRLPAKTVSEAEVLVNKIIHYDSPQSFGRWRNQITLVADDGDGTEHLRDAEEVANMLQQSQPAYNIKKIYLDMFPQEAVPNGQRSKATVAEIEKAIDQGSLILNYTGHGNETSLAHEQIITTSQITNWKNLDKLTFFLTATCEFGRFDDPKRNSGAELALLNKEGGAIGMLTTTRPVFASSNRLLSRNFYQYAFTPVNGEAPRLGSLMLNTKNSSISQINNRNFTLLGDPTQQLATSKLQAVIKTINNLSVSETQPDTLKALANITLKGAVLDQANTVKNDFDGILHATIFEKEAIAKTLGDESYSNQSNVREIKVRETIIYDGQASVKNGEFQISFVVPKDIAYNFGTGKISLYATDGNKDATGTGNILVGGTAKTIVEDITPPIIKLFLNNTNFVTGDLTGKEATLLVNLFDESGINTTGLGIGHDITAILDDQTTNPITLNNYYKTKENSYKEGQVSYVINNLSPGPHTLTVKAWDTYNNSSEAVIKFTVSDTDKLALGKISNYPNPFFNQTTFQFSHNRAGEDLHIQIQIFTVTGKLVNTLKTQTTSTYPGTFTWNGKDERGNPLSRGIYIYKIFVRSMKDGSQTERTNKLILY